MFLKIYLIAFLVFLGIDMVWLGLVAKNIYSKYLGFLMAENVNWAAALIFYLLFVAGLVVFVIIPSLEKKSLTDAIWLGAFFGLIAYSTYDLTNLATIKNWPLAITIIDLIWGAFLSSSVSAIAFILARKTGL